MFPIIVLDISSEEKGQFTGAVRWRRTTLNCYLNNHAVYRHHGDFCCLRFNVISVVE